MNDAKELRTKMNEYSLENGQEGWMNKWKEGFLLEHAHDDPSPFYASRSVYFNHLVQGGGGWKFKD